MRRDDQFDLYRDFPQFRPEWGHIREAAEWFDRLSKARNYHLFVASAPKTGNDQLASGASDEHDLVVPRGSLLWALSSSSGLTAGFYFQLWNEGRAMVPRLSAANLAGLSDGSAPNSGKAAVPYLLTPPYVVQGTGLVHVRITNLATATNGVQLAMFFAVPDGGSASIAPPRGNRA